MMASFSQMFKPVTAGHLDVLQQSSSTLLRNQFQVRTHGNIQETVVMGVSNNYILLSNTQYGREEMYFCPFNFQLKFQILRHDWPDSKTPGIPYGIRFDRGNQALALQIFNTNPDIVNQWGHYLARKINQRNFHKLFKAKKKIGKGAFASVYLAQRLVDKKMIAVKAFSKQKQFSGQKGKQALQNQIKLMRMIDSPYITKLEQIYETQNSIYVILQCLHGKQLNEVIKSGKKFTSSEVSYMMHQILSGLQHLSAKRIIHRDLKPDNIMFKKQIGLELSVCDFGLATFADEEKYLFVRCGTPGFVAPQIINIKDLTTKSDPISDVFSVGVIFHLLIFGYSIFPGTKYNQVLAQNRSCDFNFQKTEYQIIPPATLDLLKKMLEKDPSKRPSATQCLKHPYFVGQSSMDIEEPLRNSLKQEFAFMKINSKRKSIGSEMIDENDHSKVTKQRFSISGQPYTSFKK